MEILASWPVAFVVVAIVFLFVFRQPITRLIDRTRAIGKAGLEASALEQKEAAEGNGLPDAAELTAELGDDLLEKLADTVAAKVEQVVGVQAEQRERQWALLVARHQLAAHFEKTYRIIWGGQLRALHFLAEQAGDVPAEQIRKTFYDPVPLLGLQTIRRMARVPPLGAAHRDDR